MYANKQMFNLGILKFDALEFGAISIGKVQHTFREQKFKKGKF